MFIKRIDRKEYQKNINKLFKKKIIKFFNNLNFSLGIIGGFAIFYIIFSSLYEKSQKEILFISIIAYLLSLFIVLFIDFVFITFSIYQKPEKLLHLITGKGIINDTLGNLYGIKILQRKDTSCINNNGGYDGIIEIKLIPTVKNFRALELFAMTLSDEERKIYIDDKSLNIIPHKYEPVNLAKSSFKQGYHNLQFSQELEINEEIIISYRLIGEGKIVALSPQDYLPGIPFDYSSHRIVYPVKYLIHEINFDKEYPVDVTSDRPDVIVWYGDAHVEHKNETIRAKDFFIFSGRKAALKLENPILGLQYVIRWTVIS